MIDEKEPTVLDLAVQVLKTRAEFVEAYIKNYLKQTGLTIDQCELVEQKRETEIVWFVRAKK